MGILAEVDRAIEDIRQEPLKGLVWQQVFAKYPPAFISDCERSIEGVRSMVRDWLADNMLSKESDPLSEANKVISELMNYSGTTEHAHHFLMDKCREIGLKVVAIEDDQALQEDVLSVHHAYMATFARTNTVKLIDNSDGQTWTVDSA